MNCLQKRNRLTDIENRLWVAKEEWVEERWIGVWDQQMQTITNKIEHVQYPVINL